MTHNRLFNLCTLCARILVTGLGLTLVLAISASQVQSGAGSQKNAPEALSRYYVARSGDGSDGSSWEKAYKDVQAALVMAAINGVGEIWVAKGVYYPDESWYDDNSRVSTFYLYNNIKLYGGFDTNDTKLSDRDWEKNVTVLSGDIDGNDFTDENGVVIKPDNINGKNAYHVITASNLNNSAVLDGFVITAGAAEVDSGYQYDGGGFFCDGTGLGKECSPKLMNLIFSGNYAGYGGALFITWEDGGASFPSLDKVVFSNNTAIQKGGAFYTIGGSGGTSSSHLTDVIFSGNHAGVSGGAIYVRGVGTHRLDITKATFSTNSADDWGGAITHYCTNGSCNPTWREITFSGNWAGENGGAVGNYCGGISTCNPTLINVVFSGNSAGSKGGAMENFSDDISESKPILVNVTFSGNFAGINGGAMYNRIDRTMEWGDTNPELRNCILWRNYGQSGTTLREDGSGRISVDVIDNILNEYGAKVTLKNSLLQGSGGSSDWISDGGYVDGKNNIDIDPKFVMSVDPFKAPTTDGNLRLKTNSPAIDTGINAYVTDVSSDLDGEQRKVDGDLNGTKIVDMGAYEFKVEEIFVPLVYR